MISSGIFLFLQWLNSPSTSASTSLGSNLSRTAFFGPRDRVCITYAGGGVSTSHNTTVFLTLNSGLSCSLERNCSLWVLTLVFLVCSTTEGRQLRGVTSLSIPRFPSRFSLCSFWSFLALISSFFRSCRWKSCTFLSSKHPLLGILNFKNFGIKSACLQFYRNLTQRLFLSTFIRVFS